MTAIGLFVLRIAIARPLVRRVSGTSLRPALDRFLGGRDPRPDRDSGLPRGGGCDRLSALVLGRDRGRAALAAHGIRPRLCRHRALLRSLRRGSVGRDLARPAGTQRTLGGGLARAQRSARRRRGRPRPAGCGRSRRADRAARHRRPARLAPSRLRLGLDGRPDRAARRLGHPPGREAGGRARGLRPALLECRLRLGPRVARDRRRCRGPASADTRCALAHVVRQGDPDQGRDPPRRDAARLRQPVEDEARPLAARGSANHRRGC